MAPEGGHTEEGRLTSWIEFAASMVLFLLSHILPARPRVRARLVRWLGEAGYLVGYVALSVGMLAWLIHSTGRLPYIHLWDFSLWQLWVPNLIMPFVCLLAAFGVGAPNPLSIAGGDPARFDPERPGIAGVTRHPILWALGLWSASHMVPNGDLAHLLLFGSFTLFALIGMVALDIRLRRRYGHEAWARMAARTSLVPLLASVTGRWRLALTVGRSFWVRFLMAAVAYALLILLHPPVIGVSPLPMY